MPIIYDYNMYSWPATTHAGYWWGCLLGSDHGAPGSRGIGARVHVMALAIHEPTGFSKSNLYDGLRCGLEWMGG